MMHMAAAAGEAKHHRRDDVAAALRLDIDNLCRTQSTIRHDNARNGPHAWNYHGFDSLTDSLHALPDCDRGFVTSPQSCHSPHLFSSVLCTAGPST
jgi:hypothetical protein